MHSGHSPVHGVRFRGREPRGRRDGVLNGFECRAGGAHVPDHQLPVSVLRASAAVAMCAAVQGHRVGVVTHPTQKPSGRVHVSDNGPPTERYESLYQSESY